MSAGGQFQRRPEYLCVISYWVKMTKHCCTLCFFILLLRKDIYLYDRKEIRYKFDIMTCSMKHGDLTPTTYWMLVTNFLKKSLYNIFCFDLETYIKLIAVIHITTTPPRCHIKYLNSYVSAAAPLLGEQCSH